MRLTGSLAADTKIRLGQFLTSREIAEFMTSLTGKGLECAVLEPSAGEGAFLEALAASGFQNVTAIEYDEGYCRALEGKYGKYDVRHQDFLGTERDEKYDLIIGNPPYVQWNNIEPRIRELLRGNPFWARYSNGEWDLSYAFIIWSIEKLREGGELIFIVPYNWFNSTRARSLRGYLIEHGHFETILHFGELRLFPDCFPNNIIFKYVKSPEHPKPKIMVCDYNERRGNIPSLLADARRFFDFRKEAKPAKIKCFEMDNFYDPEMWFLGAPEEVSFVKGIEDATRAAGKKGYEQLGNHFDVCVGMVSGFDKAFLLEEGEAESFTEEEKRRVFRFIKAKDCLRYSVGATSCYVFVDDIGSEAELRKMPNIYEKLSANKAELLSRYDGDKTFWWRWATVRNHEAYKRNLGKGKAFVPCIDRSLRPRFSYTDGPYYGSGDVLMVARKGGTREDMQYALAWLNSAFVQKWYRIKGSKKGQRTQYTQAYVSRMPFRAIDWFNAEEKEAYERIVALSKRLVKNNRRKETEAEIDALFGRLLDRTGSQKRASTAPNPRFYK